MPDSNDLFLDMFSDRERIVHYSDGPRRFTPGLDAVHRMTELLLAEHAPANAHVLVLGAGGGLELRALAQAHAGWHFTGVDPAGPMLDLARETMGEDAGRADLIEGYIDAAPDGPFDAATCLLTLHFLNRDERVRWFIPAFRKPSPRARDGSSAMPRLQSLPG
jgi:tRNA (cmo5U34)-methyltransferase